jgi:hypothetical protein
MAAPARRAGADPQKALRRAQKELEAAESAVTALEARLVPVAAALEDPALYTRPDGVAEAGRLGQQLEDLKRQLDAAVARWTEAGQRLESLS